ncbi:hypothetical protein TI39_contig415g00015 [Zymoseptoria brevis]|uniref:AMP-binding enzyme C-terminal domain-containing protein n=1 Tax=Zymoseptoria brevis TaxID=1047168 RepID=A0A0F4GMA1_9PEZI|nr:hypothetical protein TI39_contig415g00015 [Zymoseptoria brevis]
MGDIGDVADGKVYVVDREKGIFKVNGLQVAPPPELEDALVALPTVKDAGVIGSGQTSGAPNRAFVVPANASITTDEVKQQLYARLTRCKVNNCKIRFVDAISKSVTGKTLKDELRKMAPHLKNATLLGAKEHQETAQPESTSREVQQRGGLSTEQTPGSGSFIASPDRHTSPSASAASDLNFTFDNFVDFGDSLNKLSLPDMATVLSTHPGSQTADTIDTGLQCLEVETPRDSPLHMAARRGSQKIVQMLLQHGADINARDAQSMTPLTLAILQNHEAVASILLARGADVLALDHQQRSALHLAVLHRRERLLRIIVRHCGKSSGVLDSYDMEGRTPLHVAIEMDFVSAVDVLCAGGANVQLQPGLRIT